MSTFGWCHTGQCVGGKAKTQCPGVVTTTFYGPPRELVCDCSCHSKQTTEAEGFPPPSTTTEVSAEPPTEQQQGGTP